jgi:hypothetical protein
MTPLKLLHSVVISSPIEPEVRDLQNLLRNSVYILNYAACPTIMHQGHNIPWELVSSNFEFRENNNHFTPAITGLFSRNRSNGSKEIKHFISRFVHAIHVFSETERAKYPIRKKIIPFSEVSLFPDELLKKHPKYLNEKNQRMENWILRAKKTQYDAHGNTAGFTISYDTGDGDLADVVKILLHENEIETLLIMANHPEVPLASLHNLGWGHSFGFSRVKDLAVRAYLFFNSAEATGILDDGRYTRSHSYSKLLGELGESMDYPAQQVPHQEFFRSCGLYGDEFFLNSARRGRVILSEDTSRDIYVHQNRPLLNEYMKTLFSLLYRYDVVMQECGLEPLWELEIGRSYPIDRIMKIEHKWVEEKQEWVSELG